MEFEVRQLRPEDKPQCAEILAALPEWFGFPEVNAGYIESLQRLPAFVAASGDKVIGFMALEQYGERAAEIQVLAVRPELHRLGIGHQLVDVARVWCREACVRWLHVKTRGPSTPDPNYARTIQFYLAEGFDPLYESKTEWGPENAALVLIQAIQEEGEEHVEDRNSRKA